METTDVPHSKPLPPGLLEKWTRDPPYHEALGEFMLSFATAENLLFELSYRMVKRPHWEARALIVGMTLDLVMQKMRMIAQAQHRSKKFTDELSNLLDHMKELSKLRNALIHQGAEIEEDGLISINLFKARTADSLTIHSVSLNELRYASMDCLMLGLRCTRLTDARRLSSLMKDPEAKRAMRAPWRYKYREPVNINPPHSPKGRRRQNIT